MAPKKKVMSMSEFAALVQNEVPSTKTSWADEDIDLPSARTKFLLPLHSYLSFPLAMGVPEGSEEPGRGLGRFPPSGDRSGRGGRDQGPPPPPVLDYARIPTMAPFNSFVGNLPFEVNETNLSEFFSALKIREIKIPLDQEQRCRGFAYVEFVDQDSLIKGLLMSGQMLKGRYVRVDIAEARSDSFEQKTFASDWRSGVSHQISERNPSSAGRPNFESTTRFQERVFDRSTMSPVMAEARLATSDWRSNAKPMTSERPTPAASSDVSSKATPAKKPVLNLLPRTKPLPSGVPEPADVYVTKGKSNPFGAAKPIEKPAATNE